MTAPTPVMTAQPNSAAFSSGMEGSILIRETAAAMLYSEKAETPRK